MSIDGLIPLLINQTLLKSLESLSTVPKVLNSTKKLILNLLDLEIKNHNPKKKKHLKKLQHQHLRKRWLLKNQMQLILFLLLNLNPVILLMLFLKGTQLFKLYFFYYVYYFVNFDTLY